MDLNIDCVRDVMIYLIDNLHFDSEGNGARQCINWKQIYTDEYLCSKYTYDTIQYSLIKMREAGLIELLPGDRGYKELPQTHKIINFVIKDITIEGHNFIDNLQNNKVWDKIKSAGKFGLKTLVELASQKAVEIAALSIMMPK